MIVACIYAFLAGFHTVSETDLGWHMATGRYVVEHHVIPPTDVLSYTSAGEPWIYPVFGGILFYLIHAVAGYAGLTWCCALIFFAIVACLLRPPSHPECLATAVLALIGVPLLAFRMNPRPDIFTHVCFAGFLVLLWRFYRGEARTKVRQRALWLLPLLMLLWVNVHLGFIAGIGIIFGYLFLEAADLADRSKRVDALKRLKWVWPVLIATILATLLNPFGAKIYQASPVQGSLSVGDLQVDYIAELRSVPLNLASLSEALDWRNPDTSSLWWLAMAALAAIAIALWQRRLGPAVLLAAALYAGFHTLRYQGMFGIVVIVVGGSIFADLLSRRANDGKDAKFERGTSLGWQAALVIAVTLVLTCVHSLDLISSRTYILNCADELFGAGESSLFPERAADFIQREHLPGNIYQPYHLGGFTSFRLGPAYPDFIDGRNLSPAVFEEYNRLLNAPVDSSEWETEASRRNINIVLLSLVRTQGKFADFCRGKLFRPVYVDETSAVLLRNSAQNRPLLDRSEIHCDTQQFQPPANLSGVRLSEFLRNAGLVQLNLGRTTEAQDNLQRSESLTPEDPIPHLALAQIYQSEQEPEPAERELKAAVSLRRDGETAWARLAMFYLQHQQLAEAQQAIIIEAELATHPATDFALLGQVDLMLHEPERALKDFDRAETVARRAGAREDEFAGLFAEIATGRAMVYFAAQDWKRAIAYQQEATRDTPESPQIWQSLADIYQAAGQPQLAAEAHEHVSALTHSP